MADTAKRLYGPALLPNAAATIYTVPAGVTAIVRYLRIVNTDPSSIIAVTMSLGGDAAANRLLATSIAAGALLEQAVFIPMDAGDTLRAFAGTANVLAVIVAGIEVS